jgi:hypothetical protein
MMTSRSRLTLFASAILLAGSAGSARADYSFNFNSLSPSTSDQSSGIATYMNNVIGGACAVNQNCVTVQGLDINGVVQAGLGVAVAQKYTGDGHVVGPGGVSLTLGDSTGATNNSGPINMSGGTVAYDSYISNVAADSNGNNPSQLSQGFLITFSHGVSLTGTLSFDYEVFPDGTCPQLNTANCGALSGGHFANQPDLDFVASGGTTAINTTFWGITPGTGNGTSTQSPLGTELSPQLIGTWSGTVSGATSLSFMDWPSAIGMDNLKLVTATPEPMGQVFLLAGLGLVALAGKRLRRTLAKSNPEA